MTQLFILFLGLFGGQQSLSLSAIFANRNYIPAGYTCNGRNVNPELRISGVPKKAESLALIMSDPDPAFGTFDHWVMWNIPLTDKIKENSAPGTVGRNSRKENKYTGPCPPSGVHEYHFTLYALDTKLSLSDTSGKINLLNAMKGHIIAETELVGLFNK